MKMESEAPKTPNSDLVLLNLDRPTPSGLKSQDEIIRHSIDVTLEAKPVDKAVYFLSFGDDIQRLSVVQSLIDLFRQDPAGCSQRLIPKMQQNLPTASSEFHLATSVTVKSLMERKIIPLDTFVQSFLQTILIGTEHRDPVVADAWVDCLIYIIPSLPASVLQRDILQVAVSKAAHQKPVPSRVSSCRIIGVLCKKYSSVDAKRDLMPLVLSLCQDVNSDVRAAITLQIPSVVRLLGSETSKNLLLPAMVDLASDEIPKVKEAAFTSLVESIPFFSTDVIKTVVLPLLVQLMNYAFKYDHNVLLAVASGFGKMITGLERVMQQSDKETYLHYYTSIVDKSSIKLQQQQSHSLTKIPSSSGQGGSMMPRLLGDTAILCRQYCAYNFPAMAKFLYSDTSSNRLRTLHKIFKELLSDPSPAVRRSLTVSLHEVITIYGKYKNLLKPEVCKALLDQEEEVLSGFMNHLGFILVNFIQLSYNQNKQSIQDGDTLSALVACENFLSKSSNWRLHTQFIEQMEILWYLFPTETVYSSFIFRYFEKLYLHRALPIRMAYIRTIMMNLKYTPKELLRVDALNKLNDLAASHSFYDRMLYIRACDTALEIFSSPFFKEHFFFRLLQMAGDPVPNIRWGICRLLPRMYGMLKLPADKELLVDLDRLREDLGKDKDTEVLLMLDKVTHEISVAESTSISLDDQAKYDEEKKVFSLNPKLSQNFPASCAKMFEPSIHGIPLMRRSSFVEVANMLESTSTQVGPSMLVTAIEDSSGSQKGGKELTGKNPLLSSDSQPGFSDQEFLVDAGIALPINNFTPYFNGHSSSSEPKIKNKPDNENINQSSLSEHNNISSSYTNKDEIMNRIAEKTLNITNNNLESVCEMNQALIDYIVVGSLPPNDFNSKSEIINELVDGIVEKKSPQEKNGIESDCEINQAIIDCIVESLPPKSTNLDCESEKVEKLVNGLIERKLPVENNNIKIKPSEIVDAMQAVKIQSDDYDSNEMNKNETKSCSPKKKPVFRPSIPVRKKVISPEQGLAKHTEEVSNSYSRISIAEKRRSLHVRNSNNHGFDLSQVDKRRSLEGHAFDKRLSLEVVDINKNLTESCEPDVSSSNNVVQRRKRSQLPRPLSCVVLPLRNKGLDKNNTNSKLPVIRRN